MGLLTLLCLASVVVADNAARKVNKKTHSRLERAFHNKGKSTTGVFGYDEFSDSSLITLTIKKEGVPLKLTKKEQRMGWFPVRDPHNPLAKAGYDMWSPAKNGLRFRSRDAREVNCLVKGQGVETEDALRVNFECERRGHEPRHISALEKMKSMMEMHTSKGKSKSKKQKVDSEKWLADHIIQVAPHEHYYDDGELVYRASPDHHGVEYHDEGPCWMPCQSTPFEQGPWVTWHNKYFTLSDQGCLGCDHLDVHGYCAGHCSCHQFVI